MPFAPTLRAGAGRGRAAPGPAAVTGLAAIGGAAGVPARGGCALAADGAGAPFGSPALTSAGAGVGMAPLPGADAPFVGRDGTLPGAGARIGADAPLPAGIGRPPGADAPLAGNDLPSGDRGAAGLAWPAPSAGRAVIGGRPPPVSLVTGCRGAGGRGGGPAPSGALCPLGICGTSIGSFVFCNARACRPCAVAAEGRPAWGWQRMPTAAAGRWRQSPMAPAVCRA